MPKVLIATPSIQIENSKRKNRKKKKKARPEKKEIMERFCPLESLGNRSKAQGGDVVSLLGRFSASTG